MGSQHDKHNQNNQKPDDMNRQNQQGGAGQQQGGGAGQQFDKDRKQQGGQQNRQIDDNQDDLGRDVNNPNRTGNDINGKLIPRGYIEEAHFCYFSFNGEPVTITLTVPIKTLVTVDQ